MNNSKFNIKHHNSRHVFPSFGHPFDEPVAKERLTEIMDRERANQKLNTPVLYGILLGVVRAFCLSVASCVSG